MELVFLRHPISSLNQYFFRTKVLDCAMSSAFVLNRDKDTRAYVHEVRPYNYPLQCTSSCTYPRAAPGLQSNVQKVQNELAGAK